MTLTFGLPPDVVAYDNAFGDVATAAFLNARIANADNTQALNYFASILTRYLAITSATFPALVTFSSGSIADILAHPQPRTILRLVLSARAGNP